MMLEVHTPTRTQQGAILVLTAGLVAAGVGGGQWFMNADYVVYGYSVSFFLLVHIDAIFSQQFLAM